MLSAEWSDDELIRRCLKRPPSEDAWREFTRRFHATIRAVALKLFEREYGESANPELREEIVSDLVTKVYFRLVENRCQKLRRFKGANPGSVDKYLILIAINVIRDHTRLRDSDSARSRRPV